MARAITIRELLPGEWPLFGERIAGLERGVSYPLGDDRFELDHGVDYFAFFRRLGQLSYFVALDGERVVAVVAAVLRAIPRSASRPPEKVWYGCDLKVHPDHRGERLPWRMFLHGFPRKYPRCRRGYGISMNPPGGGENPVVRLAKRFGLAPLSEGPLLALYSMDADDMAAFTPTLEGALGPLSFVSHHGRKDLVLQSTGAPLPLLHVQHGPCAETGLAEPEAGHRHMFCLPESHPLITELAAAGHPADTTMTVLQHRMGHWDWRFVLTSDI
jgi:hypothetical protein